MSNESLNEQLDNYAITQDAAREARQASNELKALESLIRDVRVLALSAISAETHWARREHLQAIVDKTANI